MTEPNTALAGGILEVFAESKAWMAAFKSASRSFDRLKSAFMVERGGCERTVQREGREDGSGPQWRLAAILS